MSCRSFWAASAGNVTMLFALAFVALAIAVGAAVDYGRATTAKGALQNAADATALAYCESASTLSNSQLQSEATSYFDGVLSGQNVQNLTVTATPSANNTVGCKLTVAATGVVPTTLMNIVGVHSVKVGATSTASQGYVKLQVALALDNTGSMAGTDVAPNRIGALKSATLKFLKYLQSIEAHPGDIQVAIVPFNNGVNVGTQDASASWIDWQYFSNSGGAGDWSWDSSYNNYSTNPYGQNYYNPYQSNYNTYTNTCANWSGCWSSKLTTPNWTSSSVQTTSWNNGACTWASCWAGAGAWSGTNNHSDWTGCVMDRDQSYDVSNTAPNVSNVSTLYPAVFTPWCPEQLVPLTDNWSSLNAEVGGMKASGTTDQAIGLAWAWNALTQTAPLNAPPPPTGAQRVIVLMTDGLNTEDRWYTNQAAIDARTQLVCNNIHADNITIYTVLVRMGSSSVLQQCAGDPSRYFVVSNAAGLTSAFQSIANSLAKLHLSK